MRLVFQISILVFLLATSGCGSIAKGITEAILEQAEDVDTRQCSIQGPVAPGLSAFLDEQSRSRKNGNPTKSTKLLMIHGIGRHLPGYSGRLTERLMNELQLSVRSAKAKEFRLRDPRVAGRMGSLRVNRYTDKANTKEILFYELTWSAITELDKKAIEFDETGEQSFRRTAVNNFMKSFLNNHISDPLIYLGTARVQILASVQQAMCWMTSGDWNDYPSQSDRHCDLDDPQRLDFFKKDDIAIITHSLGSRISVDALQAMAEDAISREGSLYRHAGGPIQQKSFNVYMLANQLPLLQLGRKPARIRDQIEDYCAPEGRKHDERLINELNIFAFSDPNDLLSYAIPPKFAEENIDSRLCPTLTNISINVAQPISILGLSEVANPLEAHVGYDNDERVIAIIAHGIGTKSQSSIIARRCKWLETVYR